MTTLDILTVAVIAGLLPAAIALRTKGRNFFAWWAFGALAFIVALPASLLVRDLRPRCPDCAEPVSREAKRCPHCHAEIAGRVLAVQRREAA